MAGLAGRGGKPEVKGSQTGWTDGRPTSVTHVTTKASEIPPGLFRS
ncbi:hypothetical protein ACFSC4_21320 [Deinococcus malanensis]